MRYGGDDDIGITTSTHSGAGTSAIGPTTRRGDGIAGGQRLDTLGASTHTSSCESSRTRMLSPLRPVSCDDRAGHEHPFVRAGGDVARPMTVASVSRCASVSPSITIAAMGAGSSGAGRASVKRTVSAPRATNSVPPALQIGVGDVGREGVAADVRRAESARPSAATHADALSGARTLTRTGSLSRSTRLVAPRGDALDESTTSRPSSGRSTRGGGTRTGTTVRALSAPLRATSS